MIVVATDAPLDARDLKRLAARAIFGLARTGSSFSNGSGDFAIAFIDPPVAAHRLRRHGAGRRAPLLPTDGVSPLFQAALEATEEAVYNSLLQATTVTGNGATAEALPIDRVREILRKYNVGGPLRRFGPPRVVDKTGRSAIQMMVPARRVRPFCAEVAELADALASGASPGNRVKVRVLSSAPLSRHSLRWWRHWWKLAASP